MSLVYESLDSLPYIDAEISQAEREQATRLIRKELAPKHDTQPHSSLQELSPPQFSTLMAQEIQRHETGSPAVRGVDLSRYEAPDDLVPSNTSLETYRSALRNAYTLSTYLSWRRTNLELLEEFGKNAWLIGNSELEALLKRLESELAGIKNETEQVNRARKMAQEGSRGEIVGLEETWRRGVGKAIEVQLATNQLRGELERRRRDAVRG